MLLHISCCTPHPQQMYRPIAQCSGVISVTKPEISQQQETTHIILCCPTKELMESTCRQRPDISSSLTFCASLNEHYYHCCVFPHLDAERLDTRGTMHTHNVSPAKSVSIIVTRTDQGSITLSKIVAYHSTWACEHPLYSSASSHIASQTAPTATTAARVCFDTTA